MYACTLQHGFFSSFVLLIPKLMHDFGTTNAAFQAAAYQHLACLTGISELTAVLQHPCNIV